MARFDPTRPDFSPYGFSCERWTPTRMPRGDRHNEIELNLLESGHLTYLRGGSRVAVPAGRLTAFWAGVPHQIIDFEGVAEYFVLTIPLVWFLQWRLPERFTHGVLHGEVVVEPDPGRLASDREQFARWGEDVRAGSEERRHVSLLEIEARLRRLALATAAAADAGPGRAPRREPSATADGPALSRAEAMARFIAENFAEPLTAERIGEHVGLHPNYAMALFRQTFGTTLLRYVTEHRLSHAQRLLVTTRDPVLDVAFAAGFGSLSRFNEAFRRAFGCTPREYRQRHRDDSHPGYPLAASSLGLLPLSQAREGEASA